MSWEDKYSAEELQVIAQHWNDEPPAMCTGRCGLHSNFAGTFCNGCTYDDMPCTGYEKEINSKQ